MWMVMMEGSWQPADNDAVVAKWIRSGAVAPSSLIRHSSWAESKPISTVPQFRRHLKASSWSFWTSASKESGPPNQARRSVVWKAAAIIVGAAVLFNALSEAAAEVAGLAWLFIIGVPLAAAAISAGRLWPAAPPAWQYVTNLLLAKKRWLVSAGVLVMLAGLSGRSVRSDLVGQCEQAAAEARSLRAQDAGPADQATGFREAAEHCRTAGMLELQESMLAEHREASAEAKRRAAAERRQKFKAQLEKARRLAQDDSKLDSALDAFGKAAKLGTLEEEDAQRYGQLLQHKGRLLVEQEEYAAAVTRLEQAEQLTSSSPQLDKLLRRAQERAHDAKVRSWINGANQVAKNKKSCDTPKKILDAWQDLSQVTKEDDQYRRARAAARRLERCRKRVFRQLVRAGRESMKVQRKGWASKYERSLLDEGLDVYVKLRGKYKNRLIIEYVLFNRAWAHKIANGGSMETGYFLPNLAALGFERVTFSDGFGESYSYDLHPTNEAKTFADGLSEMGLGDPLTL